MKNELNQHKRSDKIKWAFTGIAFVLVFVMLAGVIMQIFGKGKVKPSEWFKKPETEQTQTDQTQSVVKGGVVFEQVESNGVQLLSAKVEPETYSDNGISAQSEEAVQVTAIFNPSDTSFQSGKFTIAFENPSSSWATGKTVTDYGEITQDGLTATFVPKKAFGERILITFTSDVLDEAETPLTAICRVHYYARHMNSSLLYYGNSYDSDGELYDSYSVELRNDGVVNCDDYSVGDNGGDFYNKVDLGMPILSAYTDTDVQADIHSIKVSFTDEISSSLKSAAGVSTLGTYDVTTSLSLSTAVNSLLGGASNVRSHQSAIYNVLKSAYDSGTNVLKFEFSYTTKTAGRNYRFVNNVRMNPSSLRVRANSVSLSNADLYI